MSKRTLEDLEVKGKRVIVRVDFDVPMTPGMSSGYLLGLLSWHDLEVTHTRKIIDDYRIRAALPTIHYLTEHGAKVILLSHLGQYPFYQSNLVGPEWYAEKNGLASVARRLQELVSAKVTFCPLTRGEELERGVAELQDGEILLAQNTKYEKGEAENDPKLAEYWASLGDAYVSDAFGSLHREYASTVGIPGILKENAVGFLVQKELKNLSMAVVNPRHPYVAVLGGKKLSDKIGVFETMMKLADKILVGGGIAFPFLAAQGYSVGNFDLEKDSIEQAKDLLARADGKIVLPVDAIASSGDIAPSYEVRTFGRDIPDGWKGKDIGPKTSDLFNRELLRAKAKTVVWNGPMGVYEHPRFIAGTEELCEAMTRNAALQDGVLIVCGVDSAVAAMKSGYRDQFTHVSTGGRAALDFIEGKKLPGLEVISEKSIL